MIQHWAAISDTDMGNYHELNYYIAIAYIVHESQVDWESFCVPKLYPPTGK